MPNNRDSDGTRENSNFSRRGLLRAGLGATAGLTAAGVALPDLALAGGAPVAATAPPNPYQNRPLPTPIPYINPGNGQHTFGPVPFAEPSNIYNFRGQAGVMNIMGSGRDNTGAPIVFGGPTMDMRFLHGEYVTADGATHTGSFVHI